MTVWKRMWQRSSLNKQAGIDNVTHAFCNYIACSPSSASRQTTNVLLCVSCILCLVLISVTYSCVLCLVFCSDTYF